MRCVALKFQETNKSGINDYQTCASSEYFGYNKISLFPTINMYTEKLRSTDVLCLDL